MALKIDGKSVLLARPCCLTAILKADTHGNVATSCKCHAAWTLNFDTGSYELAADQPSTWTKPETPSQDDF